MSSRPSLLPADVKPNIDDLRKTTKEIISKLDTVETVLKKYTSQSTLKQEASKIKYTQSPSSISKWKLSGNIQSKSTLVGNYQGDQTSSKKNISLDGNSTEAGYQNVQLFESVYNGGQQNKRGSNVNLERTGRSKIKIKVENENSVFNINENHQLGNRLSETSHRNSQVCLSYMDRQKSKMCAKEVSSERSSFLHPPTNSTIEALPQVRKQFGVWHRGKKGFVPPKTAPLAETRNGTPLYAGRVNHEGNIIPATVLPGIGLAYYSWNGRVFSSNYYEILELDHFAWIDEGSADDRVDVVPIGQTTDGKPLYFGRVYFEGISPRVGRVHRDENKIYIAFRGNELRIKKPYEVLVTY